MISVIAFCFALTVALMFTLIYDLYEKLRECEKTIAALQATVADGRLIASILRSEVDAEQKPKQKAARKRRRNRSRRGKTKGTAVVCYASPN